MTTLDSKRRISFVDLGREPFRIFFPADVFAGIVGVSLWPLAERDEDNTEQPRSTEKAKTEKCKTNHNMRAILRTD
jgi:hypothetical protein